MEPIRIARRDGSLIATEYRGSGSPVLGVVISGFGYTYRNPLLYYVISLLAESGADFLLVDFRYYEDEGFRALDEAGQDARFEADAAAVADAVEREAPSRERIVLAGKSLGTSVIRRCLRRPAVAAKSSLILLTPGSEWSDFIPELVRAGRPALVVGSLGDRYYPVPNLDELRAAPRVRRLELEEGDHSLETGDAVRDVETLKRIVQGMRDFLAEEGLRRAAAATAGAGGPGDGGPGDGPLRIAFRTPRLEIRPLEARDAEALYSYRSDPSVVRFQTFRPASPADAERFIAANTSSRGEPGSWLQLGIFLKGRLIGDLGVHFLNPDSSGCEIGYTVAPACRGAGIGREAVTALAARLFRDMGKRRLVASVDPDNAASVALLERAGFRREAHFRKNIRTPEGWADELVYALLAEDFEAGAAGPPTAPGA